MRHALRIAAGIACLLAVAACSSRSTDFTTEGLIVPTGQCTLDPRSVGQAEKIDDIDEGNGCQVHHAWKLYSLGDVRLSQPATLNCAMVGDLSNWMTDIVQPAARAAYGESVVAIDVAASYSCRPRNSVGGAKLSEHGFGNAFDVSGFVLEDGRKVTVEAGWYGSRADRQFIRGVHDEACAEFSTVLGPKEAHHRDHIHLDMQTRRHGGKYCR
jgi:hypothetical protein